MKKIKNGMLITLFLSLITIGYLQNAQGSPIVRARQLTNTSLHSKTIQSYTFTDKIAIGKSEFQLAINTELYHEGSFRQINAIKGYYLGLSKTMMDLTIENQDITFETKAGYPTIDLDCTVTATLVAKVYPDTPRQVLKDLEQSGFLFDGQHGQVKHYHLNLRKTNHYSLYHQ